MDLFPLCFVTWWAILIQKAASSINTINTVRLNCSSILIWFCCLCSSVLLWSSNSLSRVLLNLTAKCHRYTVAVVVKTLLRPQNAFQELFHSSTQHIQGLSCLQATQRPHLSTHQRFGTVIQFSLVAGLWLMQNNWTCFGSGVWETYPVDYLVSVMQTDTTVSPRHKPPLFVWICFNTPLWTQLVSLGNVLCHHLPDPGFKIASTPKQIAWWEFQKWIKRKLWHGTVMHDKTAAESQHFDDYCCVLTWPALIF